MDNNRFGIVTALHVMLVHVGQRQTGHVGGSVAEGGRPESRDPGQPLLVEPFELTVALELVFRQTDVAQTVKVGEQSRRQRRQVVVVQSPVRKKLSACGENCVKQVKKKKNVFTNK